MYSCRCKLLQRLQTNRQEDRKLDFYSSAGQLKKSTKNCNNKKKQGQGNQCRTPGVKFEGESKSLKIIKNQEIRNTKNKRQSKLS